MYRNYCSVKSTIRLDKDIDYEDVCAELDEYLSRYFNGHSAEEILVEWGDYLEIEGLITRTMLDGAVSSIQKCLKNKGDRDNSPFITFRADMDTLDDQVEFRVYFTNEGAKVLYADFEPVYRENAPWFDFNKDNF